MPVCTLHLLALSCPLSKFLDCLIQSSVKPLTVGRVVRWIILPKTTSTGPLLASNICWDVLITVANAGPLPDELQRLVAASWTVRAGIPSRLLEDFASRNEKLLYPDPKDVPALTGSLDKPRVSASAQSLELSAELQAWIQDFRTREGRGAVSMLNLLAFNPGKKAEYLEYGKAFAQSIGSRRGGDAKLVGTVLEVSSSPKGVHEWDEMALAHYPSITHFADMLASEDYQAVNHKYRLGALKDTFILCTTELDLPWPSGTRSKM